MLFRHLHRPLSRLLLLLLTRGLGSEGWYVLAMRVAGKNLLNFVGSVLSDDVYLVALRLLQLLRPPVRLLSTCSQLTLE